MYRGTEAVGEGRREKEIISGDRRRRDEEYNKKNSIKSSLSYKTQRVNITD